MTFRWRLLLKISTGLLAGTPEERHIRSAVNRAYYAAFGEAREFAERKGLVRTARAGSHQEVWNFLRRGAPNPKYSAAWKSIGDLGLSLTEDRKRADYQESASISLDDARQVIIKANEIVKRLRNMP